MSGIEAMCFVAGIFTGLITITVIATSYILVVLYLVT